MVIFIKTRMKTPMDRKWTISNILSMSRIVLLPFIAVIIRNDSYKTSPSSLFLLLFFVATDFLDGFLARKLNQITKLGKILDPLADKLCIITVSILIWQYKNFPFWALLFILIREVIILSGGVILLRTRDVIFSSNIAGKFGTFFTSLSLLGYLFLENASLLPYTLLVIGFTFYVLAFIFYLLDYLKVMKYAKFSASVEKVIAKLLGSLFSIK